MDKKFDSDEAKKFLAVKEEQEKERRESERKAVLEKAISALKKEFKGSPVEIFLVGSIIRPFQFSSHSDVDIVLKNYTGGKFDLWAKLEREIGRKVEIILFETSRFQESVLKEGFKVLS